MSRSSPRRRLFAALLVAALAAMTGCATSPNPAVCAVVGGLLGGGGGWALGNETPAPDGKEEAIYGGAGAILGASTGYLICRAMADEEPAPAPAPARPAPPPPAPAPAPTPEAAEERIVLRGVNFDFDKADIRPDAAVILDEAASILNDNPGRNVSVAGHTDSVGADAYNQSLSERRAAAVKDYLAGRGVDAGRLTTSGYGESNPIASNDTADGRALNRRVELNLD